ncbi:hypothetical protein O6H91_05G023700 [Diphasiastrum complanatum]|uniref:Uncharacterized protein n=1 Tax=Diphasiastrum complanatum TaxID=34168 RepID=A0ACC2DLH8_DIPCM|nr:hypothetical protein O6H91_05G023700 [Diphasiastrum complanatum]
MPLFYSLAASLQQLWRPLMYHQLYHKHLHLATWKATPASLANVHSDTKNLAMARLATRASMDIPDYLPATWTKAQGKQPVGPSLNLTAEEATFSQLEALQANDNPYPDHGVEVLYRFAGLDPFQLSRYFGQRIDLGQFDKFKRIFHHSTYRLLLDHKRRCILSSLYVSENCFKQRVLVFGHWSDQHGIFEFTLVQRLGGSWDGYWLTESLHYDGYDVSADS